MGNGLVLAGKVSAIRRGRVEAVKGTSNQDEARYVMQCVYQYAHLHEQPPRGIPLLAFLFISLADR